MTKKNDRAEDPEAMGIAVQEEEAAVPAPTAIAEEGAPGSAVSPVPGRLRAFMLAKYPDKSYEDDAALESDVADWVELADKQLEGYRVADETIRKVATAHPELMDIVEDLAKDPKMPLQVAIMRNIDVDEFYPQEGDADYEAMYKAREERMSKREEQKAYQKQIEKNLAESEAIIQNFYCENGMDEREAQALTDYADAIIGDYLDGKITPQVLGMFRNAMNYKKDVAEAREIGKTEGLNANIDAVRQQRQEATDGLPKPGMSAGTMAPPEVPKRRVIDAARILGLSEEELEARRRSMQG